MSLAMSAAPYNDNDYNNSNSAINNKRSAHNRTQKKFPHQLIDTDKINNVLQSIHNYSEPTADDSNELGEFNPPNPPVSAGVQRTIDAAPNTLPPEMAKPQTLGKTPAPAQEYSDDKLDLNNFSSNYGSKITNEEYYKRFVPNYPKQNENENMNVNRQYYNQYSASASLGTSDNNTLLEKLNYMIHLLEEQQDERVGSVTEEVVLYSFLGIFIIFIADSFSRIGKYKR